MHAKGHDIIPSMCTRIPVFSLQWEMLRKTGPNSTLLNHNAQSVIKNKSNMQAVKATPALIKETEPPLLQVVLIVLMVLMVIVVLIVQVLQVVLIVLIILMVLMVLMVLAALQGWVQLWKPCLQQGRTPNIRCIRQPQRSRLSSAATWWVSVVVGGILLACFLAQLLSPIGGHKHARTHTHTYTHIHTRTHTYTHGQAHTRTRTNTHTFTHTHIYTHIHTRTRTRTRTHTHTHKHTRSHTHMYTHNTHAHLLVL